MAWEWAGYATTGVVALAGIWGTFRSTDRQIEGQKDVARLQVEGEKEKAREERQEKRLEASYLELLVKVGQADDWAYQLFMHWSRRPQQSDEESPIPLRPEIFVKTIEAQGVLSVYWSRRITQLVEELRQHIDKAFELWIRNQTAVDMLRSMQGTDEDIVGLLRDFMAEKEAITRLDHQVREQVADELAGRHDGHADPAQS